MKSKMNLSPKALQLNNGPLYDFFVEGLKDMYWAEKEIETLLKKTKKLAYTEELSDLIEDHERQTHKHVLRLEKIFAKLKMKPETKKCESVAGIIKEAEETVGKTPENSMTRDAVIIISSQKLEHYEIASYGGLLQIALTFNMNLIVDLLEKTLNEEEEADFLLSDIAESFINFEASEEEDDDEQQEDHQNSMDPSLVRATKVK